MECNDTLGIQDDVDMCVEDIKVLWDIVRHCEILWDCVILFVSNPDVNLLQLSDGIEFAMAALESYKEKCLSELSKDPNKPVPMDAFCINECNNHGE